MLYTYIIGICFPEFLCRKKGLYTLSIFKSNALMATFFRYGLDKTTGTVNRVRMVRDMGA